MDSFESPLDRIIREAREKGAFDQLSGKGQPLRWEDDSLVPDDQRMANRMLKDNGFVPDWLERGQSLNQRYQELRSRWETARERRRSGQISETELRQAARETAAGIRALNHQVIEYNLKAPAEALHRNPYPIDAEIKELEG